MPTVILLRHGQSVWNLEHRFTGWADVDLTAAGEAQAKRAGALNGAEGLDLDGVYASVLTRAIRTAWLALAEARQAWVPMVKDWRLNERHYGGLTGFEHAPMIERYGAEQVRIWRRSFDVPPPPLEPGGEYDFTADRRYAGINIPVAESLKTTLDRVLPYWNAAIARRLRAGETLLVAAHGNSLRAIVKHIFKVSDAAIPGVEIPTGNPLLVKLTDALAVESARYLDEEMASSLPDG